LRAGAAGGERVPVSSILASQFHLSDCQRADRHSAHANKARTVSKKLPYLCGSVGQTFMPLQIGPKTKISPRMAAQVAVTNAARANGSGMNGKRPPAPHAEFFCAEVTNISYGLQRRHAVFIEAARQKPPSSIRISPHSGRAERPPLVFERTTYVVNRIDSTCTVPQQCPGQLSLLGCSPWSWPLHCRGIW
jgi:hypothetical protein